MVSQLVRHRSWRAVADLLDFARTDSDTAGLMALRDTFAQAMQKKEKEKEMEMGHFSSQRQCGGSIRHAWGDEYDGAASLQT